MFLCPSSPERWELWLNGLTWHEHGKQSMKLKVKVVVDHVFVMPYVCQVAWTMSDSTASGFRCCKRRIRRAVQQTIWNAARTWSWAVSPTCAVCFPVSPVHMSCCVLICGDMQSAGLQKRFVYCYNKFSLSLHDSYMYPLCNIVVHLCSNCG